MANFDLAFNYVMDHEDGPRKGTVTIDAGGQTRFGIASKYHPEEFPALLTMDVTAALARARQVFLKCYWPEPFNAIISDQVASKLADMCFQMGLGSGVYLAQRACSTLGHLVSEDGKIGPNTISAINAADSEKLLGLLCAFQKAKFEAEYQHAGKEAPAGLIARAMDVPK